MPYIPMGVASNTSPVRFVASPRTYESPRVAKVLLPQSSQVRELVGAGVGFTMFVSCFTMTMIQVLF